jgi:hypothetical protein
MSVARRLLILTVLAVIPSALVVGCGGEPPDKEMQQAQGAIDAARAAGADQYAHDEFVAAQEALQHANEAVQQRDYRLALNHALDSRERAQNAAAMAGDGKAAARVNAERMITAANDAIKGLQAKIKSAENARVPARNLTAPRQAAAGAERTLQEARTAFAAGNYLEAESSASAASTAVSAATKQMDTSPAPGARRRR